MSKSKVGVFSNLGRSGKDRSKEVARRLNEEFKSLDEFEQEQTLGTEQTVLTFPHLRQQPSPCAATAGLS